MGKMITFKNVGQLTQAAEELPFKPKRVYWIDTCGKTRGGHAHKATRQVFTCVKGAYDFEVDDGKNKKIYTIASHKSEGVYITNEWHSMVNCTWDCIILVMADRFCDEKDYIRDIEAWKRWIRKG